MPSAHRVIGKDRSSPAPAEGCGGSRTCLMQSASTRTTHGRSAPSRPATAHAEPVLRSHRGRQVAADCGRGGNLEILVATRPSVHRPSA